MAHHMIAAIVSIESVTPAQAGAQTAYDPPAIVYEAALEVRAGTPIDGVPGLDLLNLE